MRLSKLMLSVLAVVPVLLVWPVPAGRADGQPVSGGGTSSQVSGRSLKVIAEAVIDTLAPE